MEDKDLIKKLKELREDQLGMDDLDVKEYHDALDATIARFTSLVEERDKANSQLIMRVRNSLPWDDTMDKRCADKLADEVAVLVKTHVIDSRSPAGDALLDYRNPPSSERADRLATITKVVTEWQAKEGHDACWYYPDLFAQIMTALNIEPKLHSVPPRGQFEDGCRKFQDQTYGPKQEGATIEILAELCHDQWSGWMKYQFGKFHKLDSYTMYGGDDFRLLPQEFWDRWTRQMNTPYAELSEPEKESDRTEARKFIALFDAEGAKYGDDMASMIDATFFCGYFKKIANDRAKLLVDLTEENMALRGRLDGTIKEANKLVPDAEWVQRMTHECPGGEFEDKRVCGLCGMKAGWHKSEAFLSGFIKILKESL